MSSLPQSLLVKLRKFQVPATSGKLLRKEKTVVEEDQVSKHLNKLDVHKSNGTWWDGPMNAEGAGQCHCKATLDNL